MTLATMSPQERRLHARRGGLQRAGTTDMDALAAQGREAFQKGFVDRVRAEHPDLSEVEILRRAAALRHKHYLDMAAKSVAVRRERRAAG